MMTTNKDDDNVGDMFVIVPNNLQKLFSRYVFMAVNSFRVSQEARVPFILLHLSPAPTQVAFSWNI